MIYLLESKTWDDIGSNIATMLSAAAIVFVIFEYFANRSLRNIQLMQRCIDSYKDWLKESSKVDSKYLELLGEELFYFQRRLIDKRVAVEWIQGMIDLFQIFGLNNQVLNEYNNQQNLESLSECKNRPGYYARISFFIHLNRNIVIPELSDTDHFKKKRELALALYKHIKKYKY